MEQEENILGTEKVGKLIRAFSIPCIISMLVNSLYNIVDQIFIGQGVGYLGRWCISIPKLKVRRKEEKRSRTRNRKWNSNL